MHSFLTSSSTVPARAPGALEAHTRIGSACRSTEACTNGAGSCGWLSSTASLPRRPASMRNLRETHPNIACPALHFAAVHAPATVTMLPNWPAAAMAISPPVRIMSLHARSMAQPGPARSGIPLPKHPNSIEPCWMTRRRLAHTLAAGTSVCARQNYTASLGPVVFFAFHEAIHL